MNQKRMWALVCGSIVNGREIGDSYQCCWAKISTQLSVGFVYTEFRELLEVLNCIAINFKDRVIKTKHLATSDSDELKQPLPITRSIFFLQLIRFISCCL